jgi:hypothetical protein
MRLHLYGGRKPRPTQEKILVAPNRFICAAGNRYPGKTTASLWRVMKFCMENPGVDGFIGRWHKKKLYGTTIALWKELFPLPEWEPVYEFSGGSSVEPDYIKFKNGSLIHLLPLQHYDENLRGGNFSFGLIDQMEECPKAVWTQAVASVRGAVWLKNPDPPYDFVLDRYSRRTNASDKLRFIIATVNKNREWFWIKHLFVQKKGVDPQDVDRYLLLENKWDENEQAVQGGYYRDLAANSSSEAQLRMEVYGEDPSEYGLVFAELAYSTHVKAFEFADLKNPSFMLGYDEGWNPAPSAFIFMAVTPDGKYWIRAEHQAARCTLATHQQKLHEIANQIGFPLRAGECRFVADPTILGKRDGNGISIAEQWGRQYPWEGGTRDEQGAFSFMRSLITPDAMGRHRFTIHPDCPQLFEQMSEAEYDVDNPGFLMKRCTVHLLDAAKYPTAASRVPSAVMPAPKLDGTWHQFRAAREGKRSWLAPSFGEHGPKLFVPPGNRG